MAERQLTPAEIAANVQKTIAEAKAYEAQAEESFAAARAHDAAVESNKLERQQLQYLIEHAKIDNDIAKIAFAKCDREERFAKVNDVYHHVYAFDQPVSDTSVKKCINTLTAWSRDEPACEITLYINSPGGDIIAGFSLIDFLVDLRANGHHIRTVALGMAASMSAVILQAGDERVMGSNAILLIHEGSLGAIGSFGEVEDRVRLIEKLHTRIFSLFASRATPINPKTTERFLHAKAKRTDWWLDSGEAMSLGLVDSIL